MDLSEAGCLKHGSHRSSSSQAAYTPAAAKAQAEPEASLGLREGVRSAMALGSPITYAYISNG